MADILFYDLEGGVKKIEIKGEMIGSDARIKKIFDDHCTKPQIAHVTTHDNGAEILTIDKIINSRVSFIIDNDIKILEIAANANVYSAIEELNTLINILTDTRQPEIPEIIQPQPQPQKVDKKADAVLVAIKKSPGLGIDELSPMVGYSLSWTRKLVYQLESEKMVRHESIHPKGKERRVFFAINMDTSPPKTAQIPESMIVTSQMVNEDKLKYLYDTLSDEGQTVDELYIKVKDKGLTISDIYALGNKLVKMNIAKKVGTGALKFAKTQNEDAEIAFENIKVHRISHMKAYSLLKQHQPISAGQLSTLMGLSEDKGTGQRLITWLLKNNLIKLHSKQNGHRLYYVTMDTDIVDNSVNSTIPEAIIMRGYSETVIRRLLSIYEKFGKDKFTSSQLSDSIGCERKSAATWLSDYHQGLKAFNRETTQDGTCLYCLNQETIDKISHHILVPESSQELLSVKITKSEVLKLLTTPKTNAEISEELGTTRVHIRNLLAVLLRERLVERIPDTNPIIYKIK